MLHKMIAMQTVEAVTKKVESASSVQTCSLKKLKKKALVLLRKNKSENNEHEKIYQQ